MTSFASYEHLQFNLYVYFLHFINIEYHYITLDTLWKQTTAFMDLFIIPVNTNTDKCVNKKCSSPSVITYKTTIHWVYILIFNFSICTKQFELLIKPQLTSEMVKWQHEVRYRVFNPFYPFTSEYLVIKVYLQCL